MQREIIPTQISLIYDPDKCSIYAKKLNSCYLLKVREKVHPICEKEYRELLAELSKPIMQRFEKSFQAKKKARKNKRAFCFCGKKAFNNNLCVQHGNSAKIKAKRERISMKRAAEELERKFFLRRNPCACGEKAICKGLCKKCYDRASKTKSANQKLETCPSG